MPDDTTRPSPPSAALAPGSSPILNSRGAVSAVPLSAPPSAPAPPPAPVPPPPAAPMPGFLNLRSAANIGLRRAFSSHSDIATTTAMPGELQQHLIELEEWAIANKKDARRDAIAFWSLKIPAIFASASAGILARFDLTTVSVVAGAIASFCVIIDGVHPRGMLRNSHFRAYHDIRILSTNMVAQWRSRDSEVTADSVGRVIIRNGEKERQRIAVYIRDAETALKQKN
jgi:hypothetical protein